MSQEDQDYCHETARRAVATAALHVGVDRVSRETLDALADVTLAYMERIGKTLATQVEASGRSSCNALDAIRAVETVQGGKSWKELASFLLGKDWNQPGGSKPVPRGSGGKVGPSVTDSADSRGWMAPYPDDIYDFPTVVGDHVANPHPLPESVGASLRNARYETEEGLKEIPDEVFQASWGMPKAERPPEPSKPEAKEASKSDESKDESSSDAMDTDEPPAKKLKTEDDRPGYVPLFLPRFPHSYGQAVESIVVDAKPVAPAPVHPVRSSLVALSVSSGVTESTVRPQIVPLGRASGSKVAKILEGSMDV